jgi:hypothetical protein
MVSMLTSSVVNRGFFRAQTKDYKIGICCFSTKQLQVSMSFHMNILS